jgi:hypothetical protein
VFGRVALDEEYRGVFSQIVHLSQMGSVQSEILVLTNEEHLFVPLGKCPSEVTTPTLRSYLYNMDNAGQSPISRGHGGRADVETVRPPGP